MNIFTNCVIIDDVNNYTFDFKKLLNKTDTIIWKNCSNLKIKVRSKINKFIFENCSNIKLIMNNAIVGLELNRCNNVKINIKKNINTIEVFRSSIVLNTQTKLNLISEISKVKYQHI